MGECSTHAVRIGGRLNFSDSSSYFPGRCSDCTFLSSSCVLAALHVSSRTVSRARTPSWSVASWARQATLTSRMKPPSPSTPLPIFPNPLQLLQHPPKATTGPVQATRTRRTPAQAFPGMTSYPYRTHGTAGCITTKVTATVSSLPEETHADLPGCSERQEVECLLTLTEVKVAVGLSRRHVRT